MIYTFLTSEDIRAAIKDELLDQITTKDSDLLKSEKAAVSKVRSYLEERFAGDDIFPIIGEYSSTVAYTVPVEVTVQIPKPTLLQDNDPITLLPPTSDTIPFTYTPTFTRNNRGMVTNFCYVSGTGGADGKFYRLLQNATNKPPATEASFWEEFDPRDPNIVNIVVCYIMLYLHQRVNPRKIPTMRVDLYNDAKEWLVNVKDKEITPNLPRPNLPEQTIDFIPHGSTQTNGRYNY